MELKSKKSVSETVVEESQRKFEEERRRLVAQVVKLPNGATFTRLKPVHG